jgi:hypothetical protein
MTRLAQAVKGTGAGIEIPLVLLDLGLIAAVVILILHI